LKPTRYYTITQPTGTSSIFGELLHGHGYESQHKQDQGGVIVSKEEIQPVSNQLSIMNPWKSSRTINPRARVQ